MPAWADTALQYLGAAGLLGLLGWYGRRKIKQLDEQDERINALVESMKDKAGREHVDHMAERIFDKIDEHGRESRESIKRLENKLDDYASRQAEINRQVARDMGRQG